MYYETCEMIVNSSSKVFTGIGAKPYFRVIKKVDISFRSVIMAPKSLLHMLINSGQDNMMKIIIIIYERFCS